MLSVVALLPAFNAPAPAVRSVTRAAGVSMETREDLKALTP